MSKHGQEALAKRDIDSVYIPHTVEKVFAPTDGGGAVMQVPDDHFVVMMNAANKGIAPTRKAFTENLLAMSAFMKAHDDVSLYLHTELHMSGGINLPELIEHCGLPKERIHAPNAYAYRMGGYTDSDLAAMYSRADVLLAVSMGEGFGIPTIEAQACGTRVIGSNAAATPELLADDCWAVEGQPEWNPMQSAFWFRPHIRPIVDALEEAYNAPRGPSQQCIEKAKEYAAETVVKRDWFPMLEAA
jgi:glycosyltransferase involved in cell wall biosynthesis